MKAMRVAALGFAACVVAALLCGCTRTPAPPVAAPARQSVPPAAPAAPTVSAAAPAPPPVSDGGANPFGAISWQSGAAPKALAESPAPPPVTFPAPAAAPVPVAPPLPFRFLGRYGDGQVQAVMLVKGDRLYLARPGETIDGAYRIDAVTAQSVELTYLPMQLKQSLGTGDAG